MGIKTTGDEKILPTIHTFSGRIRGRTLGKKSYKTEETHQIPRSSFLCPKEKLRQKESNPGSLHLEQIHSVRQIPDAEYFANSDPTAPLGIHHLHRSYRRLLASPGGQAVFPLPWVCPSEKNLLLQDYAIRAEHSSQSFHQSLKPSSSSSETQRPQCSGLSGRLASMGKLREGVHKFSSTSDTISPTPRLQDQLQEVSSRTSSGFPMAGIRLEPENSQTLHPSIKETRDCFLSEAIEKVEKLIKKTARKNFRSATVRSHNRPNTESQVKRHKQNLEEKSNRKTERQEKCHAAPPEEATPAVVPSQRPISQSASSISSSLGGNSHRCVKVGVGRICNQQKSPGGLVAPFQYLSHQCVGGHGSAFVSKEDLSEGEFPCSSDDRQYYSSPLHKQTRLKISSDKPCYPGNLETCTQKEMAFVGGPHTGRPERSSRLSFKKCPARVRMGNRQKNVLLYSRQSPKSPDRSVCDKIQSQTSDLHNPQHRSGVGGNGCFGTGLESMEHSLSVSSIQSHHESPCQTQNIQRDSGRDHAILAAEQVVSPNYRAQPEDHHSPKSGPVTDSTGRDCLRFILENREAPVDDFFKFALKLRKGISTQNAQFLDDYKSTSTQRQYNSSWKKWVAYVHRQQPTSISLDFCISFFKHLHDEGLAPLTITSYKSALTQPIRYGFNIELNSDLFNKIPKSCAKQRPAPQTKPISWSLNKVLDLASSIDNESAELSLLLGKTIFLLAMASGARVGELVGLSRDKGQICFEESGVALVFPNKLILAKNENPLKRWGPWKIIPLSSDPTLCPVKCLKDYISATSDINSGQLFRAPTSGSTITAKQLRAKLVYFIKKADPDSVPKGHDPRKVASSLSFLSSMCFSDLQRFTGWSGPRVFFKHYFKDIEEVKKSLVAAGAVIRSNE